MYPEEPLLAWDNGLAAAAATAKKYGEAIPDEALEIMEQRWTECYPSFQLVRKHGAYHIIPVYVKRSVRTK
jgi:hypothetical protein